MLNFLLTSLTVCFHTSAFRVRCSDIRENLKDFIDTAVWPDKWIISSLDPDVIARFCLHTELSGGRFTLVKFPPEFTIFLTVQIFRGYEHTVVTPDKFVQLVTGDINEVLVRSLNGPVSAKLNHSLGPVNRVENSGITKFFGDLLPGKDATNMITFAIRHA